MKLFLDIMGACLGLLVGLPLLLDAAAAAKYVARTITARPEVTNRPAIARRLVEIVEGQQRF